MKMLLAGAWFIAVMVLFVLISTQTRAQTGVQFGRVIGTPDTICVYDRNQVCVPFMSTSGGTAVIGGEAAPPINMITLGADPTGVLDSCGPALTNALAALPSTGGVLYWPRGTYRCDNRILVSNKSIAIDGDGPKLSVIRFTSSAADDAGISISQSTHAFWTRVRGLGLITDVAQTSNSALSISYANVANLSSMTEISGVEISSGPTDNNYWFSGISCTGCTQAHISNVNIRGKDELNPAGGMSSNNMRYAIKSAGRAQQIELDHVNIVFAQYCGYFSGQPESSLWQKSVCLATNFGIYYDDFVGSGDTTSLLGVAGPRIEGFHCAAYFECVTIKGYKFSQIYGSLFFKRVESTSDYTTIKLLDGESSTGTFLGTNLSKISGTNIFFGHATATTSPSTSTGIQFGLRAAGNNINGNIFNDVDFALNPGSNVQVNKFTGNFGAAIASTGAWFTSPPVGLIVYDNDPINAGGTDTGIVTFTANATTPSVGGYVSSTFMTANTNPTIITNLLNGFIGQVVTIVAGEALTTIQNNATIILAGGANFLMANADTITLKKETATVWRERGRTE